MTKLSKVPIVSLLLIYIYCADAQFFCFIGALPAIKFVVVNACEKTAIVMQVAKIELLLIKYIEIKLQKTVKITDNILNFIILSFDEIGLLMVSQGEFL